ncbi:MAG: ATP-binding protein [Erysipelotrichaceae bacterium]|nr:ATP-binding protein [Erysipelotrichaceae bacterium]
MKHIDIPIKDSEELLAQRKRYTEELLRDPLIQRYLMQEKLDGQLVRQFPMRFRKLQEQLAICDKCPGLNACRLPNHGFIQALTFDTVLKSEYRPCRYQRAYNRDYVHLQRFRINDLADENRRVLIKGIDINQETNQDYIKAVTKLTKWLIDPQPRGYYLEGPVGVGKTYLAACIANQWAMDCRSVSFIHMPTYLSRLKEAFDDNDEQERLIAAAKRADLLVMDDLGAETITSWYRDEILLPILNYRVDRQLCTYFTSNLSFKELETNFKYNQKGEVDEMKAVRIMERVRMLAEDLPIKGKNRRSHL